MAKFEIVMPKMGESVIEATITKWLKKEGDTVEEDDSIAEIATDKVDSEIPSPVEGTIKKLLYNEGDTVAVGEVIAEMSVEGEEGEGEGEEEGEEEATEEKSTASSGKEETKAQEPAEPEKGQVPVSETDIKNYSAKDFESLSGFYSPLVRSIAQKENVSVEELQSIQGSGKEGRVTKRDILNYIEKRGEKGKAAATQEPSAPKEEPAAQTSAASQPSGATQAIQAPKVQAWEGDNIIEMDRMRRMIADHMVTSKHVSPHVTMFIDVDMTDIVNWRNKVKKEFQQREGEKITFTPIFLEAAAKALKDYPRVNASVDGYNIIERKKINIGMATALPDGNLIVPVIKDADQKNLLGLTKSVNDLANRARNKKLSPDEVAGGTFSLTNFGSFNNITGSPIINQPEVAILGVGAIQKKPVVVESSAGDMIGIRHITILSITFDHRVVDGAMGGMFLNRVKHYLESFDTERNM
ncbi:MAG: 2-oxo acid dehydrogenase subunit E2 [Bacteroidales bacterium]|nr:2-oxo acid dehydrogenase subunit E2 [Bacteroidales bacterium]MCF8334227.1 2-oxo acid dehydrogenase subunit E2 [Bacteroidales bacterium]